MRIRHTLATMCLLLPLAASAQVTGDVQMTLTLETLNRVANRVGHLSEAGLFRPEPPPALRPALGSCEFFGHFDCLDTPAKGSAQGALRPQPLPLARCVLPSGEVRLLPLPHPEPVAWQWWITDSAFTVEGSQLRFTASVRARIGTRWSRHTGSADAEIRLSADKQHAMVEIADFEVPLEAPLNGTLQQITTVDVGQLRSFSVDIHPQPLAVPRPDGTSEALSMRVSSLKEVRYTPDAIELDFDVGF